MMIEPLSKEKAADEVKRRLEHGRFVTTIHADDRMSDDDRDINDLEILAVLRAGKCTKVDPPIGKPDWRYTFSTNFLEVVIAFHDHDRILVVTATEK